jgi:hypothetical protein
VIGVNRGGKGRMEFSTDSCVSGIFFPGEGNVLGGQASE